MTHGGKSTEVLDIYFPLTQDPLDDRRISLAHHLRHLLRPRERTVCPHPSNVLIQLGASFLGTGWYPNIMLWATRLDSQAYLLSLVEARPEDSIRQQSHKFLPTASRLCVSRLQLCSDSSLYREDPNVVDPNKWKHITLVSFSTYTRIDPASSKQLIYPTTQRLTPQDWADLFKNTAGKKALYWQD